MRKYRKGVPAAEAACLAAGVAAFAAVVAVFDPDPVAAALYAMCGAAAGAASALIAVGAGK